MYFNSYTYARQPHLYLLIALEGWYHYVESEPCTLAMNIWLEGPVASLLKCSPGMSYYLLRASMHTCIQQQLKATSFNDTSKHLQSPQVSSSSSSSSSSSANSVNNKKRMRSNSSHGGGADEVDKGSTGVSSYEDFRSLFNRLIVSRVTPTPPLHLSDDEHTLVSMSYTDMLLYWPMMAIEAPIQWYNMLYNLSPQAVYLLTTHWDEIEKEEVCDEEGQKELSAFFQKILHPPQHIQQGSVCNSSNWSSSYNNDSSSNRSGGESSLDTGIVVSICYLHYTP